MKIKSLFTGIIGAALLAGGVSGAMAADQDEKLKKIEEAVHAKLKEARPELSFGAVTESPIPGLYQTSIDNGPALYVSGDGNYFVAGDMFQVTPGEFVNLQEIERQKDRSKLIAAVERKDMIIFAPEGEVKGAINVFTDVDCGFCRKLHQEVPALNAKGIEVRYLAYPRAGVGSASSHKLETAWCADDQQDVLTKLKNREDVETKPCKDAPVVDQLALGLKMGVQGTPAIFLDDGTKISGYRPADVLAAELGL